MDITGTINAEMSKIVKANEKIAEVVVDGYKKIETGVVEGYKKIEDGVVGGYKKMEDGFVENSDWRDVGQSISLSVVMEAAQE